MMTTATLPQNPFPGMNPYLERRDIWPGVHLLLIAELQGYLAPRLQPDYVVTVGERVYVVAEPGRNGAGAGSGDTIIPDVTAIPDVTVIADAAARAGPERATPKPERSSVAVAVQLPAIELARERYLEVRRVDSRHQVVAVIELLSPTNKSGDGRREYLSKRAEALYSPTHLVEIDLLRAGRPMPLAADAPTSQYRVLVVDGRRTEPIADLYPFGIRQPVPDFIMPLDEGAESIAVNLNGLINDVYAARYYNLLIDYQTDPEPPLSDGDRVWLDQLLREQGLRKTAN